MMERHVRRVEAGLSILVLLTLACLFITAALYALVYVWYLGLGEIVWTWGWVLPVAVAAAYVAGWIGEKIGAVPFSQDDTEGE